MFEQQAEHIAYIIAEAVRRKATTVEPSKEAQEAWGTTIREMAVDTSAFDLSCTPGYYNNEGSGFGEGIRSFLGDYFMAGFYPFDDLLKAWREAGDLDGLELKKTDA
jgi:cyclohexanone monooxygenase